MNDRNPIILPDVQNKNPSCPKCKNENFTRRMHFGVLTSKCPKCGNEWQGGLPHVPEDPLRPMLPVSSPPPVQQVSQRDRHGRVVVVEELRRPVSLTPDFRRGAPITDDGEL